jgi:hypothetical protein
LPLAQICVTLHQIDTCPDGEFARPFPPGYQLGKGACWLPVPESCEKLSFLIFTF